MTAPMHPDLPGELAADDDVLWWRVGILEPGGRRFEVDAPSGWIMSDWQAYAERYHGPGCDLAPIAGLPPPRAPVNLDEALAAACDGVAGISPAGFHALLSPEDVADIAGGAIHPKTLGAYAQSFAEGMRSGRIGAPVHVREGAKPGPGSGSIVITEAEIEAARTGRTVEKQGAFTAAQEVNA